MSVAIGAIFVEGLSFDYAHFLEGHPVCSRLHGHTSNVRLEITGEIAGDGMLVDFSVVKMILREVLTSFDHRLIVDRRHVEVVAEGVVVRALNAAGETMRMDLPKSDVVLLDGAATIENITFAVMRRLREQFDGHVEGLTSVRVTCTEASTKGAMSGYGVDTGC